MSKSVFRQWFFNSVTGSLPQTVRAINFGLIVIDALLNIITLSYREYQTIDLGLSAGFYLFISVA